MGVAESGIGEAVKPAMGMFSGTLGTLASYAWVLIPLVLMALVGGGIFIFFMFKKKKSQWTHTLIMKRVLQNNQLSKPMTIRMRRFPLIKRAEVFELETPLLGGYLLPELDKYSGENEFSIILDTNNRIYTNNGEIFCPDKNTINVSAKHSEIDIQRSNLKADFQNINKISKRVEWATIAKYAFMIIAIVAVMIVSIVAIQNWGDAQKFNAESAMAEANAMTSLAEAMKTVEATVNTQKLEILPMMKAIYGTNNIQGLLNTNLTT